MPDPIELVADNKWAQLWEEPQVIPRTALAGYTGTKQSEARFSVGAVPGGRTGLIERISKDSEVHPLGLHLPQTEVPKKARAFMLRTRLFVDADFGAPGKLDSLQVRWPGGSGTHGTERKGVGLVVMHRLLHDGSIGLRGMFEGQAPTDDNGYGRVFGKGVRMSPEAWHTIDQILILESSPGAGDGNALIRLDGEVVADLSLSSGVDHIQCLPAQRWDDELSTDLLVRRMFGGNPEKLPAKRDVTRYCRGAEIWVAKRRVALERLPPIR